MKILLIGHSIIDHFEETGMEMSAPGGIFYSTLGMLALEKKKNNITLLTGWNKKNFYLFEDLYSMTDMTPSVRLDEMPEVFLRTSGKGEREEHYLNLASQLSLNGINDWNLYDGILINMITGFDISAGQLNQIRKNYSGLIYLDIHSLSRGVDEQLNRVFRPIPDAEEWLAKIDILQCNENELSSVIQYKNELESASEIIKRGVKIVIITHGERGVNLYFHNGSAIILHCLDAVKIHAVNKVGCGDIFGAVFFYSYISTRDPLKSLHKANLAGAVAASAEVLNLKLLANLDDK
ncbi:MAG: carbohydrate kinase family protein [Melioribacteraceae bacterium]